jgi:hypothetical protein
VVAGHPDPDGRSEAARLASPHGFEPRTQYDVPATVLQSRSIFSRIESGWRSRRKVDSHGCTAARSVRSLPRGLGRCGTYHGGYQIRTMTQPGERIPHRHSTLSISEPGGRHLAVDSGAGPAPAWIGSRRHPKKSPTANGILAEREGFEPPDPSRGQRFSRPPPSTARPPLRSGIPGS